MTEIVNCPFCGGIATVGGLVPWVECQSCGASGPQKTTEAEAITAWNTRHGAGDAEEHHEVLCDICGRPTMHLGPHCFTCTKAHKKAAMAGERG